MATFHCLRSPLKAEAISKGHLVRIVPLVTNPIRCYYGPWEYTQSPTFFNTTSLPSLHHIITTNSNTPDRNLLSHNSMSSRHVKSFSTIYIDLLEGMSVTCATFHRLRSPLKMEKINTVARKVGRLHSQSTCKKSRRKEEP